VSSLFPARTVPVSTPLRPPISTLFPYTTLFRSHLSTFPPLHPFHRSTLNTLHTLSTLNTLHTLSTLNTFPHTPLYLCGRQKKPRSEEHTLNSSHVKISYAVFCLKKRNLTLICDI